jgi:hypothetical protein
MENNFEAAYRDAFELARQQVLALSIAQVCEDSGARLISQSPDTTTLELTYLNSPLRLELPACTFSSQTASVVHIWDKILILHYLANAKSAAAPAREISFKELKTAAQYYPSFEGRCLIPLMKVFGGHTEQLVENARSLGGQALQAGDAGVRLQVLPKVSVSCIVWKADDEFPASASILFDSTIEQYLPAEDIVVLCQRMVLKLLKKW